MKTASGLACAISAALTWYGRKTRLPLRGLVLLAHRRPDVGIDRIGAVDRLDADPRTRCSVAPCWLARSAVARASAGSSKPSGEATRTRHASTAAPPAPATWRRCCRRRRRRASARGGAAQPPQRSCSVRRSASAWQGCSSSVSALMTCRRGAASANATSLVLRERADHRARTQRSRLRATSATVSRRAERPSCGGTMTSPPSSRTAISNVARVRSDGFSNSSATCCAGQRLRRRRAAPELALALHPRASRSSCSEARGVEVENRQEVLGTRRRPRGDAPPRTARARNGRTVEDRAEVFTAIVTVAGTLNAACVRRRTRPAPECSRRAKAGLRPRVDARQSRYSALICTYSAVRSQVQIVASSRPPVPRLTSMRTSLPCRYAAACGARSSCGRPCSNSRMPPT